MIDPLEAGPARTRPKVEPTLEQVRRTASELLVRQAAAIVGQEPAIRALTAAWLSGVHALLEGPPGTGKTRLAQALAFGAGLSFRRVQFTPDLLPSDLLGTVVSDPVGGGWTFHPGPLEGAHLVLVDDIDRAPAATQSALLETLGEGALSVEGRSRPLASPFMLMATRDPDSRHGVHALTLSELDRFGVSLRLGFPPRPVELRLLSELPSPLRSEPLPASVWEGLRLSVRRVYVSASLRRYIVELAGALRSHPLLSLGPSPRASQSLEALARAWAAIDGRGFVLPDDVKALAPLAWRHRIGRSPAAVLHGIDPDEILAETLNSVPVGWQTERRLG
jgi:MoxR-like ATPase